MNLRIVIVDDDQIVREQLRRILSAESDVEIVDECADGLSALTAVEQHEPDLLILDIGLPGMDGFDVLSALGRRSSSPLPLTVLITGFDDLAIHAFEAGAIDYLLKPSSPERIHVMLERLREYAALLHGRPIREETARNRRFCVRSGQRTTFISAEQIDWIEASGNYAILHVGKENHFLREALTKLQENILQTDFVRVSRSAIVRIDRVKAIQAAASGHHWVVLTNEQCIPITRGIREMEARLGGA